MSEPRSNVDKFRLLGGWVEQPDDLQPKLEEDINADVIIIGAGFAGLSTALELTALGASVVVLEQAFAGFGASGRNAGYLAGSMGVEFELFHKRLGVDQARKVVSFYDEGVAYVERRLGELAIDCDYLPSGVIRAVIHPSQEKGCATAWRWARSWVRSHGSWIKTKCALAVSRLRSFSVVFSTVARSIPANM